MCTRNACGEHAVCTRCARGVHAVCTRCTCRSAHAVHNAVCGAPLLLEVAEAAERAAKVREEVGAQEGPAEAELDGGAERDVAEGAGEALGLQQQQQQAGRREEDVGLDGDAQ